MPTYKDFAHAVEAVLSRHQRYNKEAYHLLDRAMEYASSELDLQGHMNAEQLHLCYCKLAQMEYGPLAYEVLDYWGIRHPRDLGAIVYHLIEIGMLKKNSNDKQSDFEKLPPFRPILDNLFMSAYDKVPLGKKHSCL